MLSVQQLQECAAEVAREFLALDYEELSARAAEVRRGVVDFSGWRTWGGREVFVDVQVGRPGWLRRRVGVEVMVSDSDDDERSSKTKSACVYFERLKNGGLRGPWPRIAH